MCYSKLKTNKQKKTVPLKEILTCTLTLDQLRLVGRAEAMTVYCIAFTVI